MIFDSNCKQYLKEVYNCCETWYVLVCLMSTNMIVNSNAQTVLMLRKVQFPYINEIVTYFKKKTVIILIHSYFA